MIPVTRVQADILPGICDWLDPQIPDATTRLSVPPKWQPADGTLLILSDDGGPTQWPVKSRHTIRLTGWASGRSEARRVVALAAGLLGGGRPPGVANVERDMGGVLDARDKTTGAWLASVIVIVHARMVQV